jgi:hypothetical protein
MTITANKKNIFKKIILKIMFLANSLQFKIKIIKMMNIAKLIKI